MDNHNHLTPEELLEFVKQQSLQDRDREERLRLQARQQAAQAAAARAPQRAQAAVRARAEEEEMLERAKQLSLAEHRRSRREREAQAGAAAAVAAAAAAAPPFARRGDPAVPEADMTDEELLELVKQRSLAAHRARRDRQARAQGAAAAAAAADADADAALPPPMMRTPSSEAQEIAAAMAASIAARDLAANDLGAAADAVGECSEVITTDPRTAAPLTGDAEWNNVYYLNVKYGVRIWVNEEAVDDAGKACVAIRIKAPSAVALAVASSEVREILKNPRPFLEKAARRRRESVHVFVDVSNIVIGAQMVPNTTGGRAGRRGELVRDVTTRIHIPRLVQLVEMGRDSDAATQAERWRSGKPTRWAFGSAVRKNVAVERLWRRCGYKPVFSQRLPGAGEQLVDDGLVGQISKDLLKYADGRGRTLVLLTGDGNANSGRASFLGAVDDAVARGWHVEVWCWKASANKAYRELAKRHAIKLRLLDSYRDHVCFKLKRPRRNACLLYTSDAADE